MKKITLSLSRDADKTWDEFVRENNGTLFHTELFLSYHGSSFNKRHLMFHKGDTLMAVLPSAIIQKNDGMVLKSPYGASFGGPVLNMDIREEEAYGIIQTITGYAKENDIKTIEFTITPYPHYKSFDQYLEFALLRNGFTCKKEICNYLDLKRVDKNYLDTLHGSVRTAIRKAEKSGIRVSISEDIDAFYPILRHNKEMNNAAPTHSLEELKRLKGLLKDDFLLYCAFCNDEMLAGTLLFRVTERSALVFYIADIEKSRPMNAVTLLMSEVIHDLAGKGLGCLDFGTSSFNMVPTHGLIRFKENFGTRGCIRDTFQWMGGSIGRTLGFSRVADNILLNIL